MRKTSVVVLLTAVCCVLLTAGCDKIVEGLFSAKEPVTITSDDGKVQATIPGNWEKKSGLHEDGLLQAANLREENYLVVIPDNKADLEDGMTVEDHSELTRSAILGNLKDGRQTAGPVMLTINGRPAVQYELRGVVSGIKIVYLHTTADGDDKFYQILTWTLPSNYQKNKPILESVINSFKETGAK